MQRRSTGFLRTSDNEIESLKLATVGAKHRRNVHAGAFRGSCQLPLQLSAEERSCRVSYCPLSFAHVQLVSPGISLCSVALYWRNDDFCAGRRRDVAFQCATAEATPTKISVRTDSPVA